MKQKSRNTAKKERNNYGGKTVMYIELPGIINEISTIYKRTVIHCRGNN